MNENITFAEIAEVINGMENAVYTDSGRSEIQKSNNHGMDTEIPHFLIAIISGIAGFLSGLILFYVVRARKPIEGISAAEFGHTMNNISKISAFQNNEVARLSRDLTSTQTKLDQLEQENITLRTRVHHLADEIERLLSVIDGNRGIN